MNWRLSAFLIGMAALLIGWSIATSDSGICQPTFVQNALTENSKDGAANCFEFWLNRYQTIIGALFAITAAIIAYVPAKKQIILSERQLIIASAQASFDLADKLRVRLQAIREMIVLIETMSSDIENAASLFSNIIEYIQPLIDHVNLYQENTDVVFVDKFQIDKDAFLSKKLSIDENLGILTFLSAQERQH